MFSFGSLRSTNQQRSVCVCWEKEDGIADDMMRMQGKEEGERDLRLYSTLRADYWEDCKSVSLRLCNFSHQSQVKREAGVLLQLLLISQLLRYSSSFTTFVFCPGFDETLDINITIDPSVSLERLQMFMRWVVIREWWFPSCYTLLHRVNNNTSRSSRILFHELL